MEPKNTLVSVQKNLYQIAQEQLAINKLVANDTKEEKQILSIKLNESSKTAVPTVLSTFNRETNSTEVTSDAARLYKAGANIIAAHKVREEEKQPYIKVERLTNAIEHLEPKKALRDFPELKEYFEKLPSIKEQVSSTRGENNRRRFEQALTERLIEKIVSNPDKNEKVKDLPAVER